METTDFMQRQLGSNFPSWNEELDKQTHHLEIFHDYTQTYLPEVYLFIAKFVRLASMTDFEVFVCGMSQIWIAWKLSNLVVLNLIRAK